MLAFPGAGSCFPRASLTTAPAGLLGSPLFILPYTHPTISNLQSDLQVVFKDHKGQVILQNIQLFCPRTCLGHGLGNLQEPGPPASALTLGCGHCHWRAASLAGPPRWWLRASSIVLQCPPLIPPSLGVFFQRNDKEKRLKFYF